MAILDKFWQQVPPTSLQLKRISIALGLPVNTIAPKKRRETTEEDLQAARASGMPVFEGRPNDPYLDFLDLPK